MGDEQTEAKLKHLEAIRDKEKDVRSLADDFDTKNERAKAAKKVHEAAVKSFHQFIHDGDQQRFDFEASDREAWREVPLEELAISAAPLKALHAADIKTIGQLTDWQAEGNGHELIELKGIGGTAVTEITDRLETFWEEHPEYCQTDDGEEGADVEENSKEVGAEIPC